MSGGTLVKQSKLDRKWGLLIGPFGAGFPAAPGLPTATPWSIMDRTDAESNAKDLADDKIKIIGLARDGDIEDFSVEFWGYHDDGPPDFLGLLGFTLGSVTAGTDATFLPSDIEKFVTEISGPMGDGANWFGCDAIVVVTAGVYGAGIFIIHNGVSIKMNLASVILNTEGIGCTHIGIHMALGTAAAAALIYVPVV